MSKIRTMGPWYGSLPQGLNGPSKDFWFIDQIGTIVGSGIWPQQDGSSGP